MGTFYDTTHGAADPYSNELSFKPAWVRPRLDGLYVAVLVLSLIALMGMMLPWVDAKWVYEPPTSPITEDQPFDYGALVDSKVGLNNPVVMLASIISEDNAIEQHQHGYGNRYEPGADYINFSSGRYDYRVGSITLGVFAAAVVMILGGLKAFWRDRMNARRQHLAAILTLAASFCFYYCADVASCIFSYEFLWVAPIITCTAALAAALVAAIGARNRRIAYAHEKAEAEAGQQ